MHRRKLVTAMAASAAAPMLPGMWGSRASRIAAAQEATPAAGFDDGLAHPMPMTPSLGVGKERAIVLGGGGIYMISFHVGYMTELIRQGIDLSKAEVVVGTSAGSVVGAMLTAGKLDELAQETDALGEFPWLIAKIMPPKEMTASQARAHELSSTTKVATPDNIRAIGAAAMAAHNPMGPAQLPDAFAGLLGFTDWPSPALHTTANDCYTGERLIVSQEDGVPVNVASAASSALAGGLGPVWVKDRLCMDGSISQSDTHCDTVAGAKRALVITLDEGGDSAVGTGLANAGMWVPIQQEIDALEKAGTKAMLVVAGLEPGVTKIDSNMDPKYILPQLEFGKKRAQEDAAKIKEFWA
jgi:NTE family protein